MKKSTYNSRFVLTGVAAAVTLAAGGNAMADSAGTPYGVQYIVDVPHVIDVEATTAKVEDTSVAAHGESAIKTTQWTVKTNNAVVLSFAGAHMNATDGKSTDGPKFYKTVVDAAGTAVDGKYDVLDTKFAVEVSGAEKTNGFSGTTDEGVDGIHHWGATGNPDKEPAALVSGDATPNATFGNIMPNDVDGIFTVDLYATGKDATGYSNQSGDYQSNVTLTVTSAEKATDL